MSYFCISRAFSACRHAEMSKRNSFATLQKAARRDNRMRQKGNRLSKLCSKWSYTCIALNYMITLHEILHVRELTNEKIRSFARIRISDIAYTLRYLNFLALYFDCKSSNTYNWIRRNTRSNIYITSLSSLNV